MHGVGRWQAHLRLRPHAAALALERGLRVRLAITGHVTRVHSGVETVGVRPSHRRHPGLLGVLCLYCIVHYIVHYIVHCMVHYMVHCMVHCIVHYIVHCMVHCIVHFT